MTKLNISLIHELKYQFYTILLVADLQFAMWFPLLSMVAVQMQLAAGLLALQLTGHDFKDASFKEQYVKNCILCDYHSL